MSQSVVIVIVRKIGTSHTTRRGEGRRKECSLSRPLTTHDSLPLSVCLTDGLLSHGYPLLRRERLHCPFSMSCKTGRSHDLEERRPPRPHHASPHRRDDPQFERRVHERERRESEQTRTTTVHRRADRLMIGVRPFARSADQLNDRVTRDHCVHPEMAIARAMARTGARPRSWPRSTWSIRTRIGHRIDK